MSLKQTTHHTTLLPTNCSPQQVFLAVEQVVETIFLDNLLQLLEVGLRCVRKGGRVGLHLRSRHHGCFFQNLGSRGNHVFQSSVSRRFFTCLKIRADKRLA